MSKAINNSVNNKKIKFKKNVIKNSDFQVLGSAVLINPNQTPTNAQSGTVELDNDVISMGANTAIQLTYNPAKLKEKTIQYIKLTCHAVDPSGQLSTDNIHKLSMVARIRYEEEDDNETVNLYKMTFSFYPRYQGEDNYSDYVIFDAPSETIRSIQIIIYNNEESTINITKTGLRYSVVMTDEAIGQAIEDLNTGTSLTPPSSGIIYNNGSLVYLVPTMTLNEWNAADKTKCNEAIIIGS